MTFTVKPVAATHYAVLGPNGATLLVSETQAGATTIAAALNAAVVTTPPPVTTTPPPVTTTPPVVPPPISTAPPPTLTSLKALIGPWISEAEMRAMNATFGKYLDAFKATYPLRWASDGPNWDRNNANYYGRDQFLMAFSQIVGDAAMMDNAMKLMVDYRTRCIEPMYVDRGNGPQIYQWQPGGLFVDAAMNKSAASLKALGYASDLCAAPYYFNGLTDKSNIEVGLRAAARMLRSFVYCHITKASGDPRPDSVNVQPSDWLPLALKVIDIMQNRQDADGGWRFQEMGGSQCPYMTGLWWDALIEYYTLIAPDARIPPMIQKSCDRIWTDCWTVSTRSMVYVDKDFSLPNGLSGTRLNPDTKLFGAPDLNNMISPGVSWLYMLTRDASYKDKALQLFSGGVDNAYVTGAPGTGGKQWNEEFATSYKVAARLV